VSGQVRPVYLHPGTQAGALGAALRRLGFTVTVLTARDHQLHPCVVVGGGPGRAVRERAYLYAAPGEDGRWWFWRSVPGDPLATVRVAPISDVSVTADRVAREVTSARIIQGRLAGTGT
jgi:hypothetical protein